MSYDAAAVRAFFDGFAEREWSRLDATPQGRTNYAIHLRALTRHIQPGMRVLDMGSGPGRFAIDIARAGCEVALADISPVQLGLARRRLEDEGLLERATGFHQLDVTDLHGLDTAAYDIVVCFGGVISYTRERYAAGLRELARVVRPGGLVLVSVMSLHGTLRLAGPLDAVGFLARLDEHIDRSAILAGENIVFTRPGSAELHQPLALFTAEGLRRAMADAQLVVEQMASSNPLIAQFQRVPQIADSAEATAVLRELELAACEVPGLLDTGSHLIAVARRSVST